MPTKRIARALPKRLLGAPRMQDAHEGWMHLQLGTPYTGHHAGDSASRGGRMRILWGRMRIL